MATKAIEEKAIPLQLKRSFDIDELFTFIDSNKKNNNADILESIIEFCEKKSVDIQIVSDIIKKNMKYKKLLLQDAVRLNFIK